MFIVLKTINQKVNKMDRIKFNIWVFFARIKLKRKIKGLKQEISDLSWHILVEELDDPELITTYKEAKLIFFMRETMLKGLQYA